jgi:hypothetical protein|tara:strand:+ start:2787 stop:3050 length:264 start_codon:yes stop_codon:yes gene_type:complete
MLLRELFERQVFAKKGNKVVRKYRCTSGARKGRTVSNVAQCFAPPDVAKRNRLRITKARVGSKMVRKTKRTKKTNAASIRVKAMNKR